MSRLNEILVGKVLSYKFEKILAKTVLTNPVHFFAFGFGSGLVPKIPGTVGSLAVLPFIFLLKDVALVEYTIACCLVSFIGIFICGHSAKLLGVHDHPGIVWDEFAGMMITFIAVPLSLTNIILGFILFRLFDIVKPWPIRFIDRQVAGGLGIMLDDILAGIFAWGCLHGINGLWL